jgi:hypothetical protein
VNPDKPQKSVLLIGKSRLVLDRTVAGLTELGYTARATNDFVDVTGRFELLDVDLVVFGGQVPPDLREALRDAIRAINPAIIFVQGLAGIPGLIVDQVRGAFNADRHEPTRAPVFTPDDRSIRLSLAEPADVKVTAWWQTTFVPPDPESDSLVLVDDHVAAGDRTYPIPGHVPAESAFATVQVGAAIHALAI